MADFTVKNCINSLRIMLLELIRRLIVNTRVNRMLVEVHRLKVYANGINSMSTAVGAILQMLVYNYVILITAPGEDLTQMTETLISKLGQTLTILNGPHEQRAERVKGLLTTCQQKMSSRPHLLANLQPTLLTIAEITSTPEDQVQKLMTLRLNILFMSHI